MEAIKLSIDTGSVPIEVVDETGNTIGEFRITPTDSDILKRYEKVSAYFETVEINEDSTEKEIDAICDDIKKQMDYLFNYNVSDTLFAKCGPLTVVANGDLFFEDVMLKLCNIIEKITDQRIEKKMAKIKKATEKYHE